MQRIELKPTGFDVHFTLPLAETAVPVDQVTVRQFHYLYWAEYGSDRQDNIKLRVNDVTVSEDRKTLSIKVPVVKDNVYEIDLGLLRSADDVELQNNFGFYTVNELAQ
jgi:cytochrome c